MRSKPHLQRLTRVLFQAGICLSLSFHPLALAADVSPPTKPLNLRLLQLGPTPDRVAIQWDAATDPGGSGIDYYVLFRNGWAVVTNTSPLGVDSYLLAGQTYEFTAAAVDLAGNISDPSDPLMVQSLPTPNLPEALSAVAVLLKFPDFPEADFGVTEIDAMLYDETTNSVDAYFREVSYGRTRLEGTTHGWYTLPQPGSNYCSFTLNEGLWYGCNTSDLLADARAVIPPGIDIDSPDVVLLIIQGMGTVGLSGGRYKYFAASWLAHSTVIHEIVHNVPGVSILHAAGLDVCSTYPVPPDLERLGSEGCFLGRYTDGYDPMGAGNSYHLSAFTKEQFGMLEPAQIQVVDEPGVYVLDALEPVSAGVKMLKLPLDHEMFYFLEYRQPTGFDGPDTPDYTLAPIDGVLIRLRVAKFPGTDANTVRPQVVLNPGTPFIDPYRGIRVEVIGKNGIQATVRVSLLDQAFRIVEIDPDPASQLTTVTFEAVIGREYQLEAGSGPAVLAPVSSRVLADRERMQIPHPTGSFPSAQFYRIRYFETAPGLDDVAD